MNELGKVTAFVVTADDPHHLLVFRHPTAGLQLPAGTIEPGEDPITAARREVAEETGLAVNSVGAVLGEEVSELGDDGAVMVKTVDSGGELFRRGHRVKVLTGHENQDIVRIREEVFDYDTTPPRLLSFTEGEVPADALTRYIRRTFVLFVEHLQPTEPWSRHADGHEFQVHWRRLAPDIPLVDGLKNQKRWLRSYYDRLQSGLKSPK